MAATAVEQEHGVTPRELFFDLEGRIEATKLVDGIERVVGGRGSGEIFGEVPISSAVTIAPSSPAPSTPFGSESRARHSRRTSADARTDPTRQSH
jgi:hypothetical protein